MHLEQIHEKVEKYLVFAICEHENREFAISRMINDQVPENWLKLSIHMKNLAREMCALCTLDQKAFEFKDMDEKMEINHEENEEKNLDETV